MTDLIEKIDWLTENVSTYEHKHVSKLKLDDFCNYSLQHENKDHCLIL